MEIHDLSIAECFMIEHAVHPDNRGLFREWFKSEELSKIAPTFSVQQASLSYSKKGVVRGMHYSLAPQGQSKRVS